MRKIYLFFFLVFSASIAFSQYNYNKYNYYSVGVKLGPDFYSYKMDDNKNGDFDPVFNYSIGVAGEYYFSWLIEFHGSVNYSSRNFAIDWYYPNIPVGPDDPEVLIRTEHSMSYINIPLEARFNVLYLNWLKVNIGAGFMTDWRFKPGETQYYNNGKIIDSEQYWQTKDFTRVLVSFPVSLNLKFYIDRHSCVEVSTAYYFYVNRMQSDYLSKPANAITPRVAFYYEW